jgi:3',5'-cyclic AMP phosphodiesterase CpdA
MRSSRLTRRQWLKWFGGTAAAATLAAHGFGGRLLAATPAPGPRKRLLRVAHITDVHVQPELRAGEGFAACLRHIQSQPDAPSLILNTGDCVMDASKRDRARTEVQWNLWKSVLKQDNGLPIAHAIGNHDVWGWNKQASGTTGDEPRWGKQYALDELGLARSYHSFDRGGWHFVALDSIHPREDRFEPRLEEEQFAWLEADLAKVGPKTPVLVMSHVPIFSVTTFAGGAGHTDDGRLICSRNGMHLDYRRIKDLFKRHPNVKATLAGHTHYVDAVDHAGVRHFCNGAACGGWWKSTRDNECPPGYALLDLYDDGTVEREYVTYGWQFDASPAQAPDAR